MRPFLHRSLGETNIEIVGRGDRLAAAAGVHAGEHVPHPPPLSAGLGPNLEHAILPGMQELVKRIDEKLKTIKAAP